MVYDHHAYNIFVVIEGKSTDDKRFFLFFLINLIYLNYSFKVVHVRLRVYKIINKYTYS